MARVTSPTSGTDMSVMSFEFFMSTARNGDPDHNGTTEFFLLDERSALNISGTGFGGFDKQGYPSSGTITYISFNAEPNYTLSIDGLNISVATFRDIVARNDVAAMQNLVLGGSDTLYGDDYLGDVLLGYGGQDRMEGRGGNDTLKGGDGNDTIAGGEGSDLIDGGAGSNYATYVSTGFDNITHGVTVSLSKQGVAQATGLGNDTLINIQNLEGSLYADTLIGDAANNIMSGAAGNDSLAGLDGDDKFFVTNGAQTVDGGAGFDFLFFSSPTNYSLALQGQAQTTSGGSILATNIEGLSGGSFNDTLIGDAATNIILSGGGNDSVAAGGGNDYITDLSGSNYLRGDDGNDNIEGGTGFDDINGNMGNDTATGGAGDDWVVGGKDNDTLSGDAGSDLVYGNLGDDTLEGGAGNDVVLGGQGNDLVSAGDGADYVSGDRGNDTMTGGAGADTFHGFVAMGQDVVTDFNRTEGDVVRLDAGTAYAVAQVGGDVVITIGPASAGESLTLKGVALASLTGDWIVGS